jgi:broad specificity phosphatase PhoE
MKRITVIRHGMPDAHHKYSKLKYIKGSDLIGFINDWNNCELSSENRIPIKLRSVLEDSSKLKRARDSARLLGIKEIDSIELLNEAELPYGFLENITLPVALWGILIRLVWFFGYNNNSESYKDFRKRIIKAREYIESFSTKSNHIAVIGHGFTNLYLKKELKRNNWLHVINNDGHNYWSYDSFEKA